MDRGGASGGGHHRANRLLPTFSGGRGQRGPKGPAPPTLGPPPPWAPASSVKWAGPRVPSSPHPGSLPLLAPHRDKSHSLGVILWSPRGPRNHVKSDVAGGPAATESGAGLTAGCSPVCCVTVATSLHLSELDFPQFIRGTRACVPTPEGCWRAQMITPVNARQAPGEAGRFTHLPETTGKMRHKHATVLSSPGTRGNEGHGPGRREASPVTAPFTPQETFWAQ